MTMVVMARVWPLCRSMTLVGKGLGLWTTTGRNGGSVCRGIKGHGISAWCNGLGSYQSSREEGFIASNTLLRGAKAEREVSSLTSAYRNYQFEPSNERLLYIYSPNNKKRDNV